MEEIEIICKRSELFMVKNVYLGFSSQNITISMVFHVKKNSCQYVRRDLINLKISILVEQANKMTFITHGFRVSVVSFSDSRAFMAVPVSYYIVWTFYTQIGDGQSGITLSLNYSTLYSLLFLYLSLILLQKGLMPLSTIFSYSWTSALLDGGNQSTRRKLPTCHKSLTNFIT
jgi:hypothetical protein